MKIAIFDMDGTLVDTEIVWHKAWQMQNEKYDLGATEEGLRKMIGMPRQNFEANRDEIFTKSVDTDALRPERIKFYKEYEKKYGINLKPGVVRLLKYMKDNNYVLAVCSSTNKKMVYETLNKKDILGYFDLLITGDMVKKGKPDPEIYNLVLSKLKVDASMCIAFEDSSYGVLSAACAGIKTYFIKDINDLNEEANKVVYKKLDRIDDVIDEIEI